MNKKILLIPTKIKILTWLHIGGSDQEFEIGWIDNPVITMPSFDEKVKNEPYIPWSSIKGKMRALLEKYEYNIGGKAEDGKDKFKGFIKVVFDEESKKLKKVNNDNKKWENDKDENGFYIDSNGIIQDEENEISKLFGASWKDEENKSFHITSSLIVKDFILENSYFKKLEAGELILEEKKENTVPRFIDKNTNPRTIQRVPAWTEFVWLFVIVADDENDLQAKFDLFKKWIQYIESNYLGGSWTRGYGSVKFSFAELENNENIETILEKIYEKRGYLEKNDEKRENKMKFDKSINDLEKDKFIINFNNNENTTNNQN